MNFPHNYVYLFTKLSKTSNAQCLSFKHLESDIAFISLNILKSTKLFCLCSRKSNKLLKNGEISGNFLKLFVVPNEQILKLRIVFIA